ncbi:MAG: TIGR04452 family lipoprotein [Spirochaetia bacterium]|nr:TIGR04452 family lipoprotein [Spirochaetia bacterium]
MIVIKNFLHYLKYRFLSFSLTLFIFTGCTYIQIPFPNEIQGNEARNMILDTIMITEIMVYSQYPHLVTPESPYLNGIFNNMMFEQQELFDNFFVPALIKINEKKMYKKDTVEECVEIIPFHSFFYAEQGIPFPNILATIHCNIEEASLLQVGKSHIL